jgi:hypothetical protein
MELARYVASRVAHLAQLPEKEREEALALEVLSVQLAAARILDEAS